MKIKKPLTEQEILREHELSRRWVVKTETGTTYLLSGNHGNYIATRVFRNNPNQLSEMYRLTNDEIYRGSILKGASIKDKKPVESAPVVTIMDEPVMVAETRSGTTYEIKGIPHSVLTGNSIDNPKNGVKSMPVDSILYKQTNYYKKITDKHRKLDESDIV